MVERLFLAVPRGCLQFVIWGFPDHTHLLFFYTGNKICQILDSINTIYFFKTHPIRLWSAMLSSLHIFVLE